MENLGAESSEQLEAHNDSSVPEWVIVGESVLSEVIGAYHFQVRNEGTFN